MEASRPVTHRRKRTKAGKCSGGAGGEGAAANASTLTTRHSPFWCRPLRRRDPLEDLQALYHVVSGGAPPCTPSRRRPPPTTRAGLRYSPPCAATLTAHSVPSPPLCSPPNKQQRSLACPSRCAKACCAIARLAHQSAVRRPHRLPCERLHRRPRQSPCCPAPPNMYSPRSSRSCAASLASCGGRIAASKPWAWRAAAACDRRRRRRRRCRCHRCPPAAPPTRLTALAHLA